MNEKMIRVYADTSVYGGVFDEEFATASRAFFQEVRQGRFRLVISTVVRDELEDAPERVRTLFDEMCAVGEIADAHEEALRLQQAYLDAAIVAPRWETDALHVSLATVTQCRLLISWNFKHIVNFQKIPLYNGVNLSNGYEAIAIHSPQEVVSYEIQDENV